MNPYLSEAGQGTGAYKRWTAPPGAAVVVAEVNLMLEAGAKRFEFESRFTGDASRELCWTLLGYWR